MQASQNGIATISGTEITVITSNWSGYATQDGITDISGATVGVIADYRGKLAS